MKSILEPPHPEECYACGAMEYLEEHHIFYGSANRKQSEAAGLKVHLCIRCHRGSRTGVHGGNKELDQQLKRSAQLIYEKSHSRAEFMDLIGRNYIEESQNEKYSG